MPAKDRHGKTAQDYRNTLIAEFDNVLDYYFRRKARHPPLLRLHFALLWLNPLKRSDGYIPFNSRSHLSRRWTFHSRTFLPQLDTHIYYKAITAFSFSLACSRQEIIDRRKYSVAAAMPRLIQKIQTQIFKHCLSHLPAPAKEALLILLNFHPY